MRVFLTAVDVDYFIMINLYGFCIQCILALRNIKKRVKDFSYSIIERSFPQIRMLLFITVHVSQILKKEKCRFTKEP